jgi:transposase
MTLMIGIDPHKGSHTAVAVDDSEQALAELTVRSGPAQLERLLAWAARFPERSWAVENASGLGYLLAQQLVGAGERVVDVQPKLAARVRLLGSQAVNKNDPHDARSVAIAALRSPVPVEVRREDHSAVAKLWSKRQRDLARARNKVACRLHSLLCELVPGGVPDEIYAGKAAKLLASVQPEGAVGAARAELAGDLLADLCRLDDQVKESKRRLAAVVEASRTSTTEIFGVGPVVAATAIGLTGDVARFPNRDHFASFNGTAPIDVSSGGKKVNRLSRRGSRHFNHAIHMAAVTQIRHRHSDGRVYYDRKVAEGKGHKEALRCLKRRISDALYACMVQDARRDGLLVEKGPGGQTGNVSVASATGSHPETPALRPSHSQARSQATTTRRGSTPKKARVKTSVTTTRKAPRKAS